MIQPIWRQVERCGKKYWVSGRAEDWTSAFIDHLGSDFDDFMRRHAERNQRERERSDNYTYDERIAGYVDDFHYTHLEGLSYCTVKDQPGRVIVIDTFERRLVAEAQDWRAWFERPELPPATLRLWREGCERARETGITVHSAPNVVELLLDEMERMSVWQICALNGIDGDFF